MSPSDAGAAALAVALRPAFTAWGSPITWVELIAVVLALWMVGCNMRVRPLGWPLAMASAALYALLFWDARLYGDAALQLVFITVAGWGWWQWLRGTDAHGRALQVNRLARPVALKALGITLLAWPLLGFFLDRFTDTDVPYWDAFPTTLSLLGQWLLGRKHIENWPTWILVNTVSVALFAYKGLWLTVVLYTLFIGLSVAGWRAWQRQLLRTA